jgi:thymidylate kinase
VTDQVDPAPRRGVLIAAEGLDGSGTSAGVEAIARWLERRGRRPLLVAWQRSRLVARSAGSARGRHVLTPRVAALLSAVDAAHWIGREVRDGLERGEVVLCDRYAWTGVAREIARGLDPVWVSGLYRFAPRPDLVILHRDAPGKALARALGAQRGSLRLEAAAGEFGNFLDRLVAAYDDLAEAAAAALPDRGRHGPWPAEIVVVDPRSRVPVRGDAVRDALRRLFADIPEVVA